MVEGTAVCETGEAKSGNDVDNSIAGVSRAVVGETMASGVFVSDNDSSLSGNAEQATRKNKPNNNKKICLLPFLLLIQFGIILITSNMLLTTCKSML